MSASESVDGTNGAEITPMMSIRGGPAGLFHQPIHESLTLAILISGNFGVAHGTTVDNATNEDWEYIRGAVWNDDPACLLFDDDEVHNHVYSTGLKWGYFYNAGAIEWKNLSSSRFRNPTGRSHYGDLQFLHCMASQSGELPVETKRKLMVWLEVMYKLANREDGINGDTEIGSTKLSEFCPVLSLPPSFKPLRFLLANESSFEGTNVGRRALGSMFHIIQDSYAIGHTKRTLLNSQDKESDDSLKFKPGTVDQWGAIENFHTYSGQNEAAHSHYDYSNNPLSNSGNLGNLAQFDGFIGCHMAIEKCKGLMTLKQSGTKWNNGVKDYLDRDVFALSSRPTPANNQV
ncbi:hypothetical protein MMC26_001416 [Xylographa opegraphella]|nr:hypothetical protein [Xylographa opegraphella]